MTTDIEVTAPAVTIQAPNPADRAKLFAALAKAQAAFKTVQKNKQANYGKYADLTSILEAVRPALNANGIFLYQDVRSVQGGVTVRTILAHESGQSLESSELFMPSGANGKINAAQAFGSARTYACRYSLSSFLGIAADDDDDGNASGAPGQPTPKRTPPNPSSARNRFDNIPIEDIPY